MERTSCGLVQSLAHRSNLHMAKSVSSDILLCIARALFTQAAKRKTSCEVMADTSCFRGAVSFFDARSILSSAPILSARACRRYVCRWCDLCAGLIQIGDRQGATDDQYRHGVAKVRSAAESLQHEITHALTYGHDVAEVLLDRTKHRISGRESVASTMYHQVSPDTHKKKKKTRTAFGDRRRDSITKIHSALHKSATPIGNIPNDTMSQH